MRRAEKTLIDGATEALYAVEHGAGTSQHPMLPGKTGANAAGLADAELAAIAGKVTLQAKKCMRPITRDPRPLFVRQEPITLKEAHISSREHDSSLHLRVCMLPIPIDSVALVREMYLLRSKPIASAPTTDPAQGPRTGRHSHRFFHRGIHFRCCSLASRPGVPTSDGLRAGP